MKILLIGSGGREHALAWKLTQNKEVEKIFVCPGNAGTQILNKCVNVSLKDNEAMLDYALVNKIDLTIVGPEQPLVDGIVNLFEKHNLKIFGPDKFSAQLEGSKVFSKHFMKKFGIATATYKSFKKPDLAKKYLNTVAYPIVIKASGLAAGKGVNICFNKQQAIKTVDDFMVDDIFKGAGEQIVVEEYLCGVEASIICVTDSKTIVPLISAKDYKTINENNKGPNTGGMGSICPNPYVTKDVMEDFKVNIMDKTLEGIKKTKMNFKGFVFFGVMITNKGCKLLEYNVRMGDPECQSIMMMMDFDLVKMIQACLDKRLSSFKMNWYKGYAINVVLTSGGYPGKYNIDEQIKINGNPQIFFAGAKIVNNKLLTNGGRVLSVFERGNSLNEAIKQVYQSATKVKFKKMHYRKDIGS
jgi:phosphoribosylamine--glycine ligase